MTSARDADGRDIELAAGDSSGSPARAAAADCYPVAGEGFTGGRWSDNAFRAGGFGSAETAAWDPPGLSADRAVLPDLAVTAARVRDIVRNDPTARAAVDRLADLIVGPRLTLSSPDAAALGISAEDAHALGDSIEAEWRLWGEDPRYPNDRRRKLTIHGQLRLAVRTWLTCNEALAVLTWRKGPAAAGFRYATCLDQINPDRLSNPLGSIVDTPTLRGGVEMDAAGAPVAYHIRNAHASDWWARADAWTWTRVPRETAWGRPVVVHAFTPDQEEQTRGISPFVALITSLRMIGKFAENTIAAAATNALFAAFVETNLSVDDAAKMLDPQASIAAGGVGAAERTVAHLERHPPKLNGVRMPVLPPGSKVSMNGTPRETTAFPAFRTAFLQGIAAAFGLSYEQLAMDWTKTNYSSARAALNEVWRSVRRMSAAFVEGYVMPVFHAVVEEAFDKGYLVRPRRAAATAPSGMGHNGGPPLDDDGLAPDFWDMPGAYLRSVWIGPPRGYVDPVKEGEAAALRMETLTSTLEDENAEQGKQFLETLDQIARENRELAKRGLTRESLVGVVQQSKGPKPESEEAEEPTGAQEGGSGGDGGGSS